MVKIELKFTSPSKLETLNNPTEVNKVQWTYGGNNEYPLSLDIEKWQICSDVNGKAAYITNWLVNQETNAMVLPEESGDSYSKIDFAFVVSMLGQIVKRDDLIRYLNDLKEAFENIDTDEQKVPKHENTDENRNNNQ
jgi:hypothetical protein